MAEGSVSFFGGLFLEVYNTSRRETLCMPDSLRDLEAHRNALLAAIAGLHDMRPGSIVGAIRRCGKPTCHCAQADDPGHGPSLRITYKLRGKTVTEALPGNAAVRKAEQEIAEFRRFQKLSEELVEVSGQVCRQRPVEDTLTSQEKKLSTPSRPRSRGK
jgi:hypothetical protein